MGIKSITKAVYVTFLFKMLEASITTIMIKKGKTLEKNPNLVPRVNTSRPLVGNPLKNLEENQIKIQTIGPTKIK